MTKMGAAAKKKAFLLIYLNPWTRKRNKRKFKIFFENNFLYSWNSTDYLFEIQSRTQQSTTCKRFRENLLDRSFSSPNRKIRKPERFKRWKASRVRWKSNRGIFFDGLLERVGKAIRKILENEFFLVFFIVRKYGKGVWGNFRRGFPWHYST